MNSININIDDYLSDEEKKQIAKEAFRDACMRRSKDDFERILSNAGYDLVQKSVDEAMDGNMAEVIKTKSLEIINGLTAFSVFKEKDIWDKEESSAWKILQGAVRDNKTLLEEKVAEIIGNLGHGVVRELLEKELLDALVARVVKE